MTDTDPYRSVAESKREMLPHPMEVKRRAVGDLSGAGFAPDVAQNWAQAFVRVQSRMRL